MDIADPANRRRTEERADRAAQVRIVLHPAAAAVALLAIALLLCGASLSLHYGALVLGDPLAARVLPVLDVDQENNVPSWYSTILLAAASLLLVVAGLAERGAGGPLALGFLALSAVFLGLSLDEAASLHEQAIDPLQRRLGATGALYSAWVVPGAVFAAAVGLLSLRFLRRSPTRSCSPSAGRCSSPGRSEWRWRDGDTSTRATRNWAGRRGGT